MLQRLEKIQAKWRGFSVIMQWVPTLRNIRGINFRRWWDGLDMRCEWRVGVDRIRSDKVVQGAKGGSQVVRHPGRPPKDGHIAGH